MYDRETRSLWTQITGRALAGPMKGARLSEIPSELTSWREWRQRHPDTLVLVKPPLSGSTYRNYYADPHSIGVRGTRNPDERLPAKELVIGIEQDESAITIPLGAAERKELVNLEAGGTPLLLIARGGAARLYDRRVGGEPLTFERVGDNDPLAVVRDVESGSTWDVPSGTARSGPMAGRQLDPISFRIGYWGVWAQFHRGSEIIRP